MERAWTPFLSDSEAKRLSELRDQLCTKDSHCRKCFMRSGVRQNPPNIFRLRHENHRPYFFFIFDKPHDNDSTDPAQVPVTIFSGEDPFKNNRSRVNLLTLLDKLGDRVGHGSNELEVPRVIHVTNVIKCDRCGKTDRAKGIRVRKIQKENCLQMFLRQELEILRPAKLVIFGVNACKYLSRLMTYPDASAEAWTWFKPRDVMLWGRNYKALLVPHTASQAFYRLGGGGDDYLDIPDDWWRLPDA